MAGVYISWPFCAQKCTYCNFASGVHSKAVEVEYSHALTREIAAHQWAFTPDTLYIGGGTPSAAEPSLIIPVLQALPASQLREATIETAPGSFDETKVRSWVHAGINRVSLGVQSFVKAELTRTGRRHDSQVVREDIALLRAHGISNINVDLIAGLPGQTSRSWQESLDAVIALEAPHVSVYMLEVDEDSRLGSEIILGGQRYGASRVPPEDDISEFYETAVDQLAQHGILRYEISNFARPGAESIHNLKYWHREPYVGFGADAHSFDGTSRWQNAEGVRAYLGSPSPTCESVPDEIEEKFFVGLRLSEGVAVTPEEWSRFGRTFERFISEGVLERADGRLRLTPRGVMVSNEIFQEFLAA